MRLALVYLSTASAAMALSGCSWLGNATGYKNPFAKQKAANHQGYNPYLGAQQAAARCQILSPQHPIPAGCRPEQVTLATNGHAGGFPQQPQYGQPQYTDGSYGTAAAQAGQMAAHHRTGPKLKKPRLRGSLSLGIEKSLSGSLLDYNERLGLDPRAGFDYDPQVFNEAGETTGSQAEGVIEEVTYTANELFADDPFNPITFERDSLPSISFDDAWSTPSTIKGGLEYVLNGRTTIFANGGYTQAEGNEGNISSYEATVYKVTETTNYRTETDAAGEEIEGSYVEDGNPVVQIEYVPNKNIANYSYDFTDQKRYDLEIGARHYFDPLVKSEGFRTITPFVGASVGAAHVNAVEITVGQNQVGYQSSFEEALVGSLPPRYFDVPAGNPGASPLVNTTTRLYDSAWIPQGQLNVGAEWQVTPGMALALESGVKFEGAREYSDFTDPTTGDAISGRKGDANISIPLTLRGSVNF